jgi:hypothetical protein
MPHSEAQAWWADVQHVRESIERRRAGGAESSAPPDASNERRFSRAAADPLHEMGDLDWTSSLPARSAGRFDHAGVADSAARRRPDDRAANDPGPDEPWDFDAERATLEREPVWHEEPRSSSPGDGGAAATLTAPLSPPTRRTVQITGGTVAAPRLVEVERRRPARRPVERVGPRPDRVALWAVLLGFFLILVAATSSHAATRPAHLNGAAVALHAPAR